MGFQAKSAGVIMMNDRIILFVKFGEEKYIKRLFNGRMYFSTAAKFRQTEQKLGLKGQGDAGEAIWKLKNAQTILSNRNMAKPHQFFVPNWDVQFAGVSNIPVFCMTHITLDDCTVLNESNKRILKVNDHIKSIIKEHFPKADTAGVFFQPQRFIDSLAGLGATCHDRVRYFDFSPKGVIKEMAEYIAKQPGVISRSNRLLASMRMETNDGERNRLKITERNMKHILFCKDYYFAGENEYRIILPQKRIDVPKEYTIRWGKQKRKMYSIDEFFNGIEL